MAFAGAWLSRAGSGDGGQPAERASAAKVGMLSWVALLLLAGCVVFLFLLSNRFYARLDLSGGKLYSLSAGSKRLLRDIKDPIEIRAYFSKELPPQYAAVRSYTRDLLQEYKSASRGRVRFIFADMEKNGAQEAPKHGVAPIQFNVLSKEKFEVREGYMGLVLQHGAEKEVIPVVTDSQGLEYDITSRIVRLTREKRKVVGVVSSQGAVSSGRLHERVRELMERNYDLKDADLKDLAARTTDFADLASLLLLGPKEKLGPEQLYALDQFLMSGRPVVVALDTRRANLQSFFAQELDTGLLDFLKHHGFQVKRNYVLDLQSQKVSVAQQAGWFTITNIIDYPFFVVATDLNREHPVTRDLNSLTVPFVSPMEVSTRTAAGEVHVLARSSKASWLRSAWANGGFMSISPTQRDIAPTQGDPKGPFTLAAALEDRFSSYFSTATDAAQPVPAKTDKSKFLARSGAKNRLLVVGTSMFADADASRRGGSGPVFLMNLVEWSALDSDLISIRSKGVVFKPLREISVMSKRLVRWGNILLPAALVMAFGMVRLWRRRRNRSRRIAIYTPLKKAAHAA